MTGSTTGLRPRWVRGVLAVVLTVAPATPLACGGADRTAPRAKAPEGTRSESIDHESCDANGAHVQKLDTNGDGKTDINRVFDGDPDKGARELCRVVDLNHDGHPDLYEYFDGSGAIRRREFCYDDTGVVNAIELYQGGKLVQRVYDTTGQHRIDTWDWFDPNAPVDPKTGRPAHPVRRERDLRGDGMIDQWWTWNGDKVSIGTDRNGDGKIDPESVVVLGDDAGGGGAAAAPQPAAPAASSEAVSDSGTGEGARP